MAWAAAAVMGFSLSVGEANAAPMDFVVGDHPDGELWKENPQKGPYGLRLDRVLWSLGDNLATLNVVNEVNITFDPDAGTASMSGTMEMSYNNGSAIPNTPELWSLAYTFSG